MRRDGGESFRRARAALAFFLAALLSLAPPVAAADKLRLSLRLKKGQSYRQRVVFTQKISVGGSRLDQGLIHRSLNLVLDFEVLSVDASGAATVIGNYRSLFYMQNDLTGSVVYDSDNPTPRVPAAVRDLAPLIGRSFTLRTTPDGGLGEIEGVGGEVAAQIMSFYPDGPVAIGDSWARSMEIPGESPLLLDSAFTLGARHDGLAVINIRADIRQTPGSPPVDIGGLMQGTDLVGSLEGPLEVAEESGWPLRAAWSYRFSGQVELGGDLQLPIQLTAPLAGEGSFGFEPQ